MAVVDVEPATGLQQLPDLAGPPVDAREPAQRAERDAHDVERVVIERIRGVEHVGAHEPRAILEARAARDVARGIDRGR